MRTKAKARDWRSDDGALVTEAAILFPLVFIVVFFVIQFAMVLWADMIVEQAARHGVRQSVQAGVADPATMNARAAAGTSSVLNNVVSGISNVTVQPTTNMSTRTVQVRVEADPMVALPGMNEHFGFRVDAVAQARFEEFRSPTERG